MSVQSLTLPRYELLEPGFQLPRRAFQVQRKDLVRYGGAARDYNPIHWDDRTATEFGLPGPIAQGMLTMGLALGYLVEWAGDPGAVVDFGGRFPRLVPVPNDGVGVELSLEATVAEKLEPPRVRVNLAVRLDGAKVLVMPRVIVVLR
ncbi:MaoC/PaaZ C-terminal domain-containing protein [Planotetraspora sp. A-T 1434]|uniref:MaoC/PaaZ C-terminal domain-containing protein n=1 Tax=Planotetraspora sp. A-T 1434 TaxID=2979219 RepID=UPI0021C10DD2|nr:MaoC/PaaZ C-terminal domain-containing protein [Planotetraspora sp. A-T 1434]MCT9930522.1 MaoC/PaaZ C-terminal domain-containing protein [Planotetraspora sp. A-T 1434]